MLHASAARVAIGAFPVLRPGKLRWSRSLGRGQKAFLFNREGRWLRAQIGAHSLLTTRKELIGIL
jgi:hypothetical protein